MAEFMGELATKMNLPKEHAICVSGESVVQAGKRAVNNRRRGMKLLTEELRRKLPALYAQDGKGGKATVYTKLFTPDSGWSWWITEGSAIKDESGHEVDFQFFGLVQGHEKELGYFNLAELEGVTGPMGLPIERDLYWELKTLEEIGPELFQTTEKGGE